MSSEKLAVHIVLFCDKFISNHMIRATDPSPETAPEAGPRSVLELDHDLNALVLLKALLLNS